MLSQIFKKLAARLFAVVRWLLASPRRSARLAFAGLLAVALTKVISANRHFGGAAPKEPSEPLSAGHQDRR